MYLIYEHFFLIIPLVSACISCAAYYLLQRNSGMTRSSSIIASVLIFLTVITVSVSVFFYGIPDISRSHSAMNGGGSSQKLEYHPPQGAYAPVVIPLPLAEVRTHIIGVIDPTSELIPQLSPEEQQKKEHDALAQHNMEALNCLAASDKATIAQCKARSTALSDCINSAKNAGDIDDCTAGTDKSTREGREKWPFQIFAVNELEQSTSSLAQSYAYLTELNTTRGFAHTDSALHAYLTVPQAERIDDFVLSEDHIDMASDGFIKVNKDFVSTQSLRKYRVIDEYTWKGRPVLATSEYIVRLRTLSPSQTEVDILPIFPRVLAGEHLETGCHGGICPRMVYDLRPVEQFNAERMELSLYIKGMFDNNTPQ